jgi:hypothetical protein
MPPYEYTCLVCKKEFVTNRQRPQRKCCGRACQHEAQRGVRKSKRPYIYTCLICKKEYVRYKWHTNRKYCGKACHSAAMRAPAKLCKLCEKPFHGGRNKVYCAAECRATAKASRESKPKRKRIRKPRCGVPQKRDLPITPEIKALYERALRIGARAAGRDVGLDKNAVIGRLWRRGFNLSRGTLTTAENKEHML